MANAEKIEDIPGYAEAKAQLDAQLASQAKPEDANPDETSTSKPMYSVDELDAALRDDYKGWVPEGRFKEISAEKHKAERERDELLQHVLKQKQEQQSAEPKPQERNFSAELKAIKSQLKEGSLTEEEYEEARDSIREAMAEQKLDAKYGAEVATLKDSVREFQQREQQQALQAEAQKWIKRYPFLDIKNEETRNMEAIDAVIAERDRLRNLGVDGPTALRAAVNMIAPEVAESLRENDDEPPARPSNVADIRRQQAQRAAIAAAEKIPPNIAKSGANRGDAEKIVMPMNPTVDDAERWMKMTPEQRRSIVVR